MRVYQTLEDRDNPDEIEENGPFACKSSNAWLGEGYYFWEYFIQNAHWWGKVGYNSEYVICEASYKKDKGDRCLNLYDNYEHQEIFAHVIENMRSKGLYRDNKTTVARVIKYLRDIKVFKYEATKINGVLSKGIKNSLHVKCKANNNKGYVDLIPAVQICFYHKKALDLSGYKIVFPEKYLQEGVF